MKSIISFLIFCFFLSIFSLPLLSQTNFPAIYIDGQLFQGRTLLYNNILYVECDALMKATGATHIYNIPENLHYINNKVYSNDNVYIYENRFYFYLKTAVLAAGANKAAYDKNTNTIIIEFPSASQGTYTAQTGQTGSQDFVDFDNVKNAEGGFTEHYDSNEQLDAIYKDVAAYLYSKYNMQVPAAVQLLAVSKNELEHVAQEEGIMEGLQIAGLYWNNKIYIEYDLPVAQIYEVMAHEYTHAWQQYNCPGDQEDLLREGFAEWIAYKYTQGKTSGATFSNKGNTVYGKGLNFFLEMEKEVGETGVIEYVKKNNKAQ